MSFINLHILPKFNRGGSTQSTKLFLETGVRITGNALYFYQKLIFFPGEHALPDPLSYGMSDVNPHLTLM